MKWCFFIFLEKLFLKFQVSLKIRETILTFLLLNFRNSGHFQDKNLLPKIKFFTVPQVCLSSLHFVLSVFFKQKQMKFYRNVIYTLALYDTYL